MIFLGQKKLIFRFFEWTLFAKLKKNTDLGVIFRGNSYARGFVRINTEETWASPRSLVSSPIESRNNAAIMFSLFQDVSSMKGKIDVNGKYLEAHCNLSSDQQSMYRVSQNDLLSFDCLYVSNQ